jgi:hypothetical protein
MVLNDQLVANLPEWSDRSSKQCALLYLSYKCNNHDLFEGLRI